MSDRGDKERRRQQRLSDERAQAARATRRRELRLYGAIAAALVAVVVVLVVGLSGRRGDSGGAVRVRADRVATPTTPATSDTRGLPAQIVANLREGNRVVDGKVSERLAALKGVPVVVNQWAAWCPNCKAEFPFFEHLSEKYKRRVAFLGLDSQDDRGNAERFLEQFPVNYPSIFDESADQARSLGGGQGWPTTIYYDRSGRQKFVRQGGYTTEATLEADIRRYAIGA